MLDLIGCLSRSREVLYFKCTKVRQPVCSHIIIQTRFLLNLFNFCNSSLYNIYISSSLYNIFFNCFFFLSWNWFKTYSPLEKFHCQKVLLIKKRNIQHSSLKLLFSFLSVNRVNKRQTNGLTISKHYFLFYNIKRELLRRLFTCQTQPNFICNNLTEISFLMSFFYTVGLWTPSPPRAFKTKRK